MIAVWFAHQVPLDPSRQEQWFRVDDGWEITVMGADVRLVRNQAKPAPSDDVTVRNVPFVILGPHSPVPDETYVLDFDQEPKKRGRKPSP